MLMRKLMLVLVAVMCWTASVKAQSFEFQYQGKSLEDGATVTISAEPNAFGELSCETNPSANASNGLVLKLLQNASANGSATLEITENTLYPKMLQWCMGGVCTPFGDEKMLTKKLTVNEIEQVQFDATEIQSKGYLLATLKVTIGLESHQVFIQFINGEATGVAQMLKTDEKNQVMFDLKGCRIKDMRRSGIYIVPDGNQKRKVIKKK